jgi:hypothetical protein
VQPWRRARTNGRGCHAGPSPPTLSACNSIALAYNLGNFMRTLAMPKTAQPWSLTSPPREADQDRREGRRPRTLRHLPDGRGRGVDRRAAGTARARMMSAGPSAPGNERGGGEVCLGTSKSGALQRWSASAAGFGYPLPWRRRFPVGRAREKPDPGLETAGNPANVG